MAVKTLIFSLLLAFNTISCNRETQKDSPSGKEQQSLEQIQSNKIRIKTAHGDIIFKTRPDKAPNTVKRITELVKENFYDGLTFHRVVANFVIQGGDPEGTGRGGSGKKLKAEFSDLKHKKGSVAMARSQDVDSADSQFYISLGPQPHLDGQYTIFGEVLEGLEVLDKINQGDKMLSVSLE